MCDGAQTPSAVGLRAGLNLFVEFFLVMYHSVLQSPVFHE